MLLHACLFAITAMAAPAWTEADTDLRTIQIEPKLVDLGDLFTGEVGMEWVTFTNNGDSDWSVKQVKTSCGCTVAKVHGPDGNPVPSVASNNLAICTVKPNESIRVQVEFKSSSAGQISKSLFVFSLDTDEKLEVPVKARVSRGIMVTPPYVQLGNIGKSESIEQIVTVDARDIGDWTITGFESMNEGTGLPDGLTLEIMEPEGDTQRIKVVVAGPRPVGQYVAWVKLNIDHPRVKSADFRIMGSVRPDITFATGHTNFPETLVFEQLAEGTKETRTLTIVNQAPEIAYLLKDVEITGPKSDFFEATIETVNEGIEYRVHLTADGNIDLPFFRGALKLKADHPDMPEKTIPFHGWIKKTD